MDNNRNYNDTSISEQVDTVSAVKFQGLPCDSVQVDSESTANATYTH